MAHIDRATDAQHLANLLDASVSLDDGTLGENANGDRAWSMFNPADAWHIVLQDDAVPIDNFRTHAAAALAVAPPTAVSFYVGTGRPLQGLVGKAIAAADASRHAWLSFHGMLWGVGVAMPTADIPAFLEYAAGSRLPYDERIGEFWRLRGVHVRYTWPSLVDHADGPTLLHHPWGAPTAPRRAHRVGVPVSWLTETTEM